MSWWAIDWWYDFIVGPLAEKYGLSAVWEIELPHAFLLRDSTHSRAEQDDYFMWKYEHKDSKEKKKSGEYATPVMNSESDRSVINNAMESSDNYLGFIQSRGYGKYKENITVKRI